MHWKTRGRLAAAALLAAGFVAANAGTGALAGDRVLDVAQSDVAMNDAQAEARRTLESFLAHTLGPDGQSLPGATIKVAMPTSDGGAEVIWVEPFEADGGGFTGRLANAPNDLPGLSLGDEVRFGEAQVRDWAFWGEDGSLYGSFTTRVLLPRMRASQAARVAAVLSTEPVPPGW